MEKDGSWVEIMMLHHHNFRENKISKTIYVSPFFLLRHIIIYNYKLETFSEDEFITCNGVSSMTNILWAIYLHLHH